MPEDQENVKVVNVHYTQRIEGFADGLDVAHLAKVTAEFYKDLVTLGVPGSSAAAISAVMLKPAREVTQGSSDAS